jgi:uncharacterized membrane protein
MIQVRDSRKAILRPIVPVVIAVACALVFVNVADAWNFRVPAAEVRPTNGAFVFPASAFANGGARYFVYKHSPSQWIRFFVVKSTDGVIRAAFDACDVCFKSKKGYLQQGNFMVCANCGLKFRTDKINEIRGGCNPAPLRRVAKGGKLIIGLQDVLSGTKYFN